MRPALWVGLAPLPGPGRWVAASCHASLLNADIAKQWLALHAQLIPRSEAAVATAQVVVLIYAADDKKWNPSGPGLPLVPPRKAPTIAQSAAPSDLNCDYIHCIISRAPLMPRPGAGASKIYLYKNNDSGAYRIVGRNLSDRQVCQYIARARIPHIQRMRGRARAPHGWTSGRDQLVSDQGDALPRGVPDLPPGAAAAAFDHADPHSTATHATCLG